MSDQIPTHYAQQYASNIEMKLQQMGSRFRGTVSEQTITGAKAATPVEQIGATAATKRTTRYPPLTPADTPHERPWIFPSDYDWNDLIDSIDKLRMVIDPQSAYVEAGVNAMGRAIDDEIIPAFFGDRKTGQDGSTTTSFPAAQQVAVNFAAAGNVGLTVAKLREAKRLMLAAEIDFKTDLAYVGISAKQHDNLLGEFQVVSLDFNEKPVLVEGMVQRFLGFQFVFSERMQVDGNSYRRVPCWVKSGVRLGMWQSITTDISQRKDLAGHPWQIYVYGTFGATRLQEKKVVEVKCAE